MWASLIQAFKKPEHNGRQLVASGATLLDVRTREEFAGGHLDGAKNIPVQELGTRLSEVKKKNPVVVYCRSGARSSSAASLLKSKGFEVVDIGAMGNW